MGVSGSGKSSVAKLLAEELSIAFIDADDHHIPSSIEKMSKGVPLTDTDREPWLERMNEIAINHLGSGVVIACSALKKKYRQRLNQRIESNVNWVYLKCDYDLIFKRMKNRKHHFMDADMLTSQFDALEEPEDAIVINIANSLEGIVENIKLKLSMD